MWVMRRIPARKKLGSEQSQRRTWPLERLLSIDSVRVSNMESGQREFSAQFRTCSVPLSGDAFIWYRLSGVTAVDSKVLSFVVTAAAAGQYRALSLQQSPGHRVSLERTEFLRQKHTPPQLNENVDVCLASRLKATG